MNKDIKLELDAIGNNAKKAANTLSMTSENIKNDALINMARLIENNSTEILEANKIDMENAEKKVQAKVNESKQKGIKVVSEKDW